MISIGLENFMNQNDKKIIRDNLNSIGKGFCLAKWYELDLDLSAGANRSCELVQYHSIPIDDIRRSSSLFHNSEYKKIQRKFMIIGIQPKECAVCWEHESKTKKESPRLEKSMLYYEKADLTNITENGDSFDFYPKRLKLMFSRSSNVKSIIDSPENSSEWLLDIQLNGPLIINNKPYNSLDFLKYGLIYFDQKNNPYIEHFWTWFYQATNEIEFITVHGGEPLMDKNFFRLLNFYNRLGNKNLTIEIESQCDPSGERWNGFMYYVKNLSKKIKQIKLICKVNSWGPDLEYCNYGISASRIEKNLRRFLKSSTNNEVFFKINFHALTYQSFEDLMKLILDLRKKFLNKNRKIIFFEVDIVLYPIFLHPSIRKEFIFCIDNTIKFMKSNMETRGNKNIGFSEKEIDMIGNLKNEILKMNLSSHTTNFLDFLEQYDKRTNQKFDRIFK